MDYRSNIATQPPPPPPPPLPPVHYGWAVPNGIQSPGPQVLTGQPPPYVVMATSNSHYPLPLAVQLQTGTIHFTNMSSHPAEGVSYYAGSAQPAPPGWSVGPGGTGATYGKPYTQPVNVSVNVEAPDSTSHETDKPASFSDKAIRMAFIRKVYAILMVQLTVTAGFIALFLFEPNTAGFSRKHPELMLISVVCTLILTIVLLCYDDLRRTWPMNFILLMAFTICEGWMMGTFCSFFEIDEVLMAVGICAVVCLGLTIFAFQTKWDFTAYGGVMFVCLIVLTLFGFLAMIYPGGIVRLMYSALGALMFSFYLVYDTQLMLGGNHKFSISPEEYIFAALSIYLDIIQMFMHILVMIDN